MKTSIAAGPKQPGCRDTDPMRLPARPFLPLSARRAVALAGIFAGLFFHASAHADEAAEVRALVARGDLASALARAEKAAAASPRDVQLRFLQGVVLMDLQRDEEALAHFMRMAQDYPELPDPYNNIALLHARASRLEQARQALETALRNDPTHRTARANLGQVHLMLAVQAWELAAAGGPVDGNLQRKLQAARTLLAQGTPAAR
jgi:tetratricopeptide (TPR) repeat protein